MRAIFLGFSTLLWVVAGLGCAGPELDDQLWRCESHEDCGEGWLCSSTKGHCVAALNNEDGVSDDAIVFGMSAAIGSDVSLGEVGKAARAGIEACFDHVNRTGGIHGRKLKLVVMNDSYDAAKTTTNVKKMIGGDDRQVFALAGVLGTAPSLAARQLALQQRVLLFAPASGFDQLELDPPDRYVFNVRPRYSEEAGQLTRYLLRSDKPPAPAANIAVFAQGTDDQGQLDAFGKSSVAGVVKVLKGEQIAEKQLHVSTYASANTKDVRAATAGLLRWMAGSERKVSADSGKIRVGVVMVALYDAAAALIRAVSDQLNLVRGGGAPSSQLGSFSTAELARLKLVQVRFVTLSTVGVGLSTALKSFGTYQPATATTGQRRYGEGTIMALPVPHFGSSASGVLRYREHLGAYDANVPPGFISLEAYLAGALLAEGLRKQGRDLTTESFIDTLETLRVDLGIGVPLGFSSSDHQATSKLWAVQLDSALDFQAIGVLKEQ
jgi:ABC-type branched-subunit amino acid transport system substrate-binding protein